MSRHGAEIAGMVDAIARGLPAEPEAPAAGNVRDKGVICAEATTRHGSESAGPGEERAAEAAGAAISAETAIAAVRQHIRRHGHDTTGYPLSTLRAERVGIVWVVRAPAPDDDVALDRAVFYVAPDAVVERSTASVPWAVFAPRVEERFRRRRAGRADSGE
ncbi:hypothetical protein [Nocardia rhamnosiphila]